MVEIIGRSTRNIGNCRAGTLSRSSGVERREAPKDMQEKASAIKSAVDDGRLIFCKNTVSGRCKLRNTFKMLWLTPPVGLPPPQSPIIERIDYDWWSRCKRCGNRRFVPVLIFEKQHAVCYDCYPEDQHKAFGGVWDRPRLASDMANRYYPTGVEGNLWK